MVAIPRLWARFHSPQIAFTLEPRLMSHEDHHRITAKELKELLAKLPDDARLAFIADDTRCQFLGIAKSEIPEVEGVFVISLRLVHNYPPVSR